MEDFQAIIINWYKNNKRDLPWRDTNDPYKIWVSEIILQQTKVNQGINYFLNFINEFPDIKTLASSTIDKLLKVWQGLGYYNRARNMHETANQIVEKFNGIFPENYYDLLQLKGIGEYTAAAIASISFNQPYAVLDGNVYRVLARIFGIKEIISSTKSKKLFQKLANELVAKDNPSDYNQAIMDFGAIQCIPKKPDCMNCPFINKCYAFENKLIDKLPIKNKKTKTTKRYFYYLIIEYKNYIYLNKRSNKDIWQSLYEFPLIEFKSKLTDEKIMLTEEWRFLLENSELEIQKSSEFFKHILSHQVIYAKYFVIKLKKLRKKIDEQFLKIPLNKIENYPVSKLISLIIIDFQNSKKNI